MSLLSDRGPLLVETLTEEVLPLAKPEQRRYNTSKEYENSIC